VLAYARRSRTANVCLYPSYLELIGLPEKLPPENADPDLELLRANAYVV